MNETGYFAHSLYTVSFSTCCAFGAGDNGCEIMELALAPCSSCLSDLHLLYTLFLSVKSFCFAFLSFNLYSELSSFQFANKLEHGYLLSGVLITLHFV